MSYLRDSGCSICLDRLDKVIKRNIRTVTNDKIDSYKEFWPLSDIRINDFICGKCLSKFFKKYKKVESNLSTKTVVTSSRNSLSENSSSEDSSNEKRSSEDNSNEKRPSEDSVKEQDNFDEANNYEDFSYGDVFDEKNTLNDDFVKINIPRTYSTHQWCIICKRSDKKLHRISDEIIANVFIQKGILISQGARCCSIHFDQFNNLKDGEIDKIETVQEYIQLNSEKIERLFSSLKNVAQKSCLFDKFRDFGTLITDDICKETTGLFKYQFEELCFYLESLKDSDLRTKEQCVAIYLFWLKTGKFKLFLFIL